ncbi:hypothetical protein EBQ74_03320 [bacterium]|nr:hypothetical protein [bacterium]
MRFFFLSFILISSIVRAEGMPQNDQEFMRYMQAKAEQAQREDEIKNPKKPEMGKDRAVLGDRNAKIKLFVYSDFQCPYCKRGYELSKNSKRNTVKS